MLLRSAPWRRAPFALLHQPALLFSVATVAFVLGLAAAAGPLFLASTASAVVQEDLSEGCPTTAGLRVSAFGRGSGALVDQRQGALESAVADIPHLRPTELTMVGPLVPAVTGGPETPDINVRLVHRSDLATAIEPIEEVDGAGVWIPERAATELGAGAGDTIVLGADEELRVKGVYHDVVAPLPPAWCAQQRTVYPLGQDDEPDRLVFADRETFGRLEDAFTTNMSRIAWETPIDRSGLTLPEAAAASGALAAIADELRVDSSELSMAVGPFGTQLYLPDYVEVWERTRAAVSEGVLPVTITAIAIALLFVVAVARSWVEYRRTTVELLVQRGVSPAAVASLGTLEMALPTIGAALGGFAAGVVAVRTLGPSSLLDTSALRTGLTLAAVATAGALAVAFGSVALTVRRVEQPAARLRVGIVGVLAEIGILVAAGAVYARVVDEDAALLRDRGVPEVDVLHLLFPILLVIGAASIAVRLLTLVLPQFRRAGAAWPIAVVLGLRRLAGSRDAVHVLTLAAAVATGLVVSSSIVVTSADATLHAKSAVFVGSEVAARIPEPIELPPALRGTSTVASRYVNVLGPDGEPADLLGVDPETLAEGAFWDSTFADQSLAALLAALETSSVDGIPVIAVGGAGAGGDLQLGTGANASMVTVETVATARSFPGERGKPLYVADASSLGFVEEADFAEVWTTEGSSFELIGALRDAGVTVWGDVTADEVRAMGTFRTTAWTFGFLRALGSLIAVLTIGAVIAHVSARERRGRLGYAIARRCGLRIRSYAASLAIEMVVLIAGAFVVGSAVGVAAAATTHHRLDGLPRFPPAPLFRVPGTALLVAGAVTFVIVVLGAWMAQRSSERAAVVEVLRAEA
jgi:putative ABC transport system permease protein